MKILALDLGDVWVGSALSDALKITCKPHITVKINEVENFLADLLQKEFISTIVVGFPKTVSSGGQSEQTKKIISQKEALQKRFSVCKGMLITWVLWDERFSSKRASELHRGPQSKEEKIKSHSIAASFILQSYLDHLAFSKQEDE